MGRGVNKRAQEDESHVLIGLVVLAIVLFVVAVIITNYGGKIIDFIGGQAKGWLGQIVNAESSYTRASEANFERLNDELGTLLESSKKTDHKIVPYTLGQYRLVGFNKDRLNSINPYCLGDKLTETLSEECKDSSCLCLCYMEERCECEKYPQVDYFITTNGQFRNKGKNLTQTKDPVTGDDAHCLMLQGAVNEKEVLGKILEPYDNWWRSNNVYLEKIEKDGKRYVFFSRFQDIEFTERMYGGCGIFELDKGNCSLITACMDYRTAGLGCDWRYTCQKNACPGLDLECGVRENPFAQSDPERWFCLGEEESLGSYCTAGPAGESAPINGMSGDLFWVEDRGLCLKCAGLGQPDSDSWGWAQESTINKDNCKSAS